MYIELNEQANVAEMARIGTQSLCFEHEKTRAGCWQQLVCVVSQYGSQWLAHTLVPCELLVAL